MENITIPSCWDIQRWAIDGTSLAHNCIQLAEELAPCEGSENTPAATLSRSVMQFIFTLLQQGFEQERVSFPLYAATVLVLHSRGHAFVDLGYVRAGLNDAHFESGDGEDMNTLRAALSALENEEREALLPPNTTLKFNDDTTQRINRAWLLSLFPNLQKKFKFRDGMFVTSHVSGRNFSSAAKIVQDPMREIDNDTIYGDNPLRDILELTAISETTTSLEACARIVKANFDKGQQKRSVSMQFLDRHRISMTLQDFSCTFPGYYLEVNDGGVSIPEPFKLYTMTKLLMARPDMLGNAAVMQPADTAALVRMAKNCYRSPYTDALDAYAAQHFNPDFRVPDNVKNTMEIIFGCLATNTANRNALLFPKLYRRVRSELAKEGIHFKSSAGEVNAAFGPELTPNALGLLLPLLSAAHSIEIECSQSIYCVLVQNLPFLQDNPNVHTIIIHYTDPQPETIESALKLLLREKKAIPEVAQTWEEGRVILSFNKPERAPIPLPAHVRVPNLLPTKPEEADEAWMKMDIPPPLVDMAEEIPRVSWLEAVEHLLSPEELYYYTIDDALGTYANASIARNGEGSGSGSGSAS